MEEHTRLILLCVQFLFFMDTTPCICISLDHSNSEHAHCKTKVGHSSNYKLNSNFRLQNNGVYECFFTTRDISLFQTKWGVL